MITTTLYEIRASLADAKAEMDDLLNTARLADAVKFVRLSVLSNEALEECDRRIAEFEEGAAA